MKKVVIIENDDFEFAISNLHSALWYINSLKRSNSKQGAQSNIENAIKLLTQEDKVERKLNNLEICVKE